MARKDVEMMTVDEIVRSRNEKLMTPSFTIKKLNRYTWRGIWSTASSICINLRRFEGTC